jgi:hypothetical protein
LDRSRNNTKVKSKCNFILIYWIAFFQIFLQIFQTFFSWKQKKSIKQICSSYCQLWSRVHTKIIIFEICPNFPTFLCNCPDFFFRKLIQNHNKQNQKRITHSHRSNPELWSWVHTKKHSQFSPNYFNLVFPDFSPNLPDFFFYWKHSIELFLSRGISNKSYYYPCMWLFTVEFQRKFNVMQHKIPKAARLLDAMFKVLVLYVRLQKESFYNLKW